MILKILKTLPFFLLLPLCAYEPFYNSERIGDSFYRPQKEEQDLFKLSGEVLFFGEGAGYLPKRCKYSPGFRLSLETLPLYKKIEFSARYTHWGREFENSFNIPVMKVTRTVANDYDFNAAELTLGRSNNLSNYFSYQPFIGIGWEKTLRETSMEGLWRVTQYSTSLGPLVGLNLKTKLHKTVSINTHLSIAYLQTSNVQRLDQKLTHTQAPYYHPKSQAGINLEYNPTSSVQLSAGYEIHHDWTKNVHNKIDWELPSNLQGFKAKISYEF